MIAGERGWFSLIRTIVFAGFGTKKSRGFVLDDGMFKNMETQSCGCFFLNFLRISAECGCVRMYEVSACCGRG